MKGKALLCYTRSDASVIKCRCMCFRSPGADGLFLIRSTGTSWSSEHIRDMWESVWLRPSFTRC